MDRQQWCVLERRHERLDLARQAAGIEEQREGDPERDEPERPDRVAPLEDQVAGQDREPEGNRELEHVAPRAAADRDRPRDEGQPEQRHRDQAEDVGAARQRARGLGVRAADAATAIHRPLGERAAHHAGERGLGSDDEAGQGAPPVGEHHGVTDVGRKGERHEDHPDREGELACRGHQAAAAPPGGGPAGTTARTSARLSIWRTRPQFAQVRIRAWRPMPHFGQVTDELVAAGRADRLFSGVDQPVACAVRLAARVDRLPGVAERGGVRALDDRQSCPRLAHHVDDPDERHQAQQRTQQPDDEEQRQEADERSPVRDDDLAHDVQDLVPDLVQLVDDAHRGILAADRPRPRRVPAASRAARRGRGAARTPARLRARCRVPGAAAGAVGSVRRPTSLGAVLRTSIGSADGRIAGRLYRCTLVAG